MIMVEDTTPLTPDHTPKPHDQQKREGKVLVNAGVYSPFTVE